jgi:putative peptidoglycan lipid II flippase
VVKSLIKKILNKNLQYNTLSLINVFIGFLFIVALGRKFGAGGETDTYFLSMVVISYLGYFVQSVWEAMSPYYAEQKVKDKNKSDRLYSILLNDLILVALFIVGLYFIFTSLFDIIPTETKQFLDIFIFYIILQNILFLNKTVLNLEHFYASFYFVDIFVYLSLFIVLFLFPNNDIIYLAYATILSTFLSNLYQFYLIFKKLNIKYSFKFYDESLKEIYKNSVKLKIGSLFYGIKDIIIASVFTSFGSGAYSLYSYANKFAGVILQVVNAPIVSIFSVQANYNVANKRYDLLQDGIKKVLSQTIVLFVVSAIITYFILPFVLGILFGDKFNGADILTIQSIFLVVIVFHFVWVVQSPYGRMNSIFKMFNFGLIISVLFAVLVLISYVIFVGFFEYNYFIFLYLLIFSKFIQFLLNYVYISKHIKIKNIGL